MKFENVEYIEDIKLEEFSRKLLVCGNRNRFKLLCLIERHSLYSKDICEIMKAVQPVVSQYVTVLKNNGIIDCNPMGREKIYRIVDPVILDIIHNFNESLEEK